MIAAPCDRAASSVRWSSSTLAALAHGRVAARSRSDRCGRRRWSAPRCVRRRRPGAGRGRGRRGRRVEAGLGEVGGVGEAGGLAGDDADAGAAVAPGATAARPGRRRDRPRVDRLSSANTSANSAPGADRTGEHPFQDVGSITRPILRASPHPHPVWRVADGASRRHPLLTFHSVNLETGLRGDAKMTVTAADTARVLGSGDVDVLGSRA